MNSIVEAKVKDYLLNRMGRAHTECGAIMFNIKKVAMVGGHEIDTRFADAGLASGPEAFVASAIVDAALGHGGNPVSEYVMKTTLDTWVRTTQAMGS